MADALDPGMKKVILVDSAGLALANALGEVAASPTQYTVQDRLKTLAASLAAMQRAAAGEFEAVAKSQTAQVLGATGAAGDYIKRIIIVPETTAPGVVTLLDGGTSYALWLGGTVGADLKPFEIEIDAISASGAWKITTGDNVHVLAIGDFT